MTDINTLIAEMRAGLEGVTPGEWYVEPNEDGVIGINAVDDDVDPWYVAKAVDNCGPGDATPRNAAHIARCSPSNIARLLDEIEYWRKDSAAAWDKCEEHRLEIERLQSKLSVYDATNAAKVEKPR